MAAKEIQVSDDSGSTWNTLPGGTGEFSEESESIDDTIFGFEWSSMEVGLITWTISANALYKGFAGYKAKLLQTGTATSTTDEATSNTTGQTYQIDDTSKRILDRSSSITVSDGGSPVSDSDIESIDYLFGKVTFVSGYSVTGSITISGDYFPTNELGTAQSFTLTQTAETIDTSDFATVQGNSGFRTFDYGLKTVSLDLTGIYSSSNDFSSKLKNRDEVIIEINPDGNQNSVARGFFKPMTHGQSGDVGVLEEETITFNLYVPDQSDLDKVFDWEFNSSSTISESVKILLNSYISSTKPDVQYLHDGINGLNGTSVLTDVSLESSLDGMNTFTANFQGDGSYTEVSP